MLISYTKSSLLRLVSLKRNHSLVYATRLLQKQKLPTPFTMQGLGLNLVDQITLTIKYKCIACIEFPFKFHFFKNYLIVANLLIIKLNHCFAIHTVLKLASIKK